MRIGMTSIVFGRQGGIARYVAELAGRFAKDNEVHVVTSRQEAAADGVTAHMRRIIWRPISLQVASAAYAYTRALNMLRRDGTIELSHGQGAEMLSPDVVTAHSCQKAAVRALALERGEAWRLLKSFEPRNNVVLAIEGRNVRDAKRIIAVSKTVKEEIVREYRVPAEKIDVIYNGVDTGEFAPANRLSMREPLRRRMGYSSEDRVLMFSGWEFRRKGLKHIIDALTNLDDSVKLLVVGGADPTPYTAQARRLSVMSRIAFAGHQVDMRAYYAAADAFVFPTSYEPFGLVITEAMASGLPVITTRTAGAAEIITDGVDGMLLSRPGDTEELAGKLKAVLDGGEAGRIGAAARKTAEKYSWDSVAEKTLSTYRDVIR